MEDTSILHLHKSHRDMRLKAGTMWLCLLTAGEPYLKTQNAGVRGATRLVPGMYFHVPHAPRPGAICCWPTPSLIEYKFMIGRLNQPSLLELLVKQVSRVRSMHVNSQRLSVRGKLRPQVLGLDMS